MAQWQELKSAQYLSTASDSPTAFESEPAAPRAPKRSPVETWQRVTSWVSAIAALAAAICLIGVGVPYISSAISDRPKSPIDWWLRLGGAKSDQTFEKFVRNAATAPQFDFDEMYKKSPVYNLDKTPMMQLNNWPTQPQFKMK
jgi:hypothetical protein